MGVFRHAVKALLVAALMIGCGRQEGEGKVVREVFDLTFHPVPAQTLRLGNPEGGPDEQRRTVKVGAFWISEREITTTQFSRFLNATQHTWEGCPGMTRRGETWYPLPDRTEHPVTHVSLADARAFCRWAEPLLKHPVRLPEESEWEAAARAGLDGTPYPWGWEPPEDRAAMDLEGPISTGSFTANRYGLFDLAGNVWEWCEPEADGTAFCRGGSWAERDPRMIQIHVRRAFPATYRDGDVGFRVVVELD